MFVFVRAITYAALFIDLVLVYVPARLLAWSGLVRPVAVEVPQVAGMVIGAAGSQAQRIIARYVRRWLVEEYHKALKSGVRVESSQLEERGRIEALLGVLVVVAVRLLGTKLLARTRPDERVDANTFGPEAIQILNKRFQRPAGGWTHASLLIAVARLGGFLARKGDGMPGWITIWRGWQRLMTMVDGVKSFSREYNGIEATRCG